MSEDKKQDEKESEFKIEDRRYFDQDGNVKPAEQQPIPEREMSPPNPPRSQALPKPDFGSILFPYIHSTLVYLGEMQDPASGKINENLEGARQMIDILELLQEKTKGNLTSEEARVLETALFDLRMQYMQKAKIVK